MTAVLKWLYLLAFTVWLGEVIFFSFVVAPGVFRAVPVETAGRIVGMIFPAYYWIGVVAGALCTGSAWFFWSRTRAASWGVAAAALFLMLTATAYAGFVLQPRATALRAAMHAESDRDAAAAAKPEFDRLHRRAVWLNGAVLVLGLVTCGATAASLRS